MFIKFIKKNLDNILIALFAISLLFIGIFFGRDNVKSEEAYFRAEAVVRSTDLQQRDLNNDLQKWYTDQNK